MAAGTVAVSAVALGLVAAGVWWFGGSAFENLMLQHGNTASIARAMFDESVVKVLLGAVTVALAGSIILSVLLAGAISRPVGQVAAAARRIGEGAYTVRVPRPSATELAALADSFNQMAVSLEDQERLRRELVSNFAHELRTPLTNLQGYLQAMRDGVVDPSAEVFASLDEEVDRLRRLSLSLDALAGDTGRNSAQERVDLVQLVGAALRLSLPAFQRRSIRIKSDLPDELYVRANPDHLAQVLLNLLQNAARYGRESGLVKMTAARDGDEVLFAISNTGDQIPPEDLPHLFERFFRVDRSRDRARGGAGVGLAIVKQLVEAAGGKVGVESTSGLTRFWFNLPA